MTRPAWWPKIWPALGGFLAGLATAGVIALSMPAAAPDAGTGTPVMATVAPPSKPASAKPTSTKPMPPASSTAGAGSAAIPQHSSAPLSPEARQRIAPLEARLVADPGDLVTRKQLAVVLIQNQQLMLAYEHASQILAADPDDPDGLYVHGVVRLAMGHAPRAIELLDRVLARHPDHALALRARADAQRRIGDEAGAAQSEARARDVARADDAQVEQLLAAAKGGTLFEMIRSTPSGETAAPATEGGANGD